AAHGAQIFMLSVTRVTEIWVGIVCAGIVLAITDSGGAPQKLAAELGAIVTGIAGGLCGALAPNNTRPSDSRDVRRQLIARVAALDGMIEAADGESSHVRYQSPRLRQAVSSLFAALSGWRAVAHQVEGSEDRETRRDADLIMQML